MSGDFADRVNGIAALAEPARRELYEYVAVQPEPVSREQAAEATGIARHNVKFHLDRLVAEGLLAVEYRRVSGRRGPGAGRPAKLYRRVSEEISVSLPQRRYELAGQILAAAVEAAVRDDQPVVAAVEREARLAGRELARTAGRVATGDGPPPWSTVGSVGSVGSVGPTSAAGVGAAAGSEGAGAAAGPAGSEGATGDGLAELVPVVAALAAHGYEPRVEDGRVVMANCPFHVLSQQHTALVCGMNRALIGGLAEELALPDTVAVLDPAPGRCCVTLVPAPRSADV